MAQYCLYGLLLTALTLAILKKIYDYDIWYPLVIGREIFRTMHIPATEFFVYPHLGEPVAFHEWGFGLFFYSIYRWFGYWGMGIANALVGSLSLFLFFRAAENKRPCNPLTALLVFALFWIVDFRLMYRPEMFFFLFLGGEIYLLERFGDDGRRKWLYAIPLLTFVLNNFHPSALFLLIVLGMYSLQFIYEAYVQKTLNLKYLGMLLGVFLVALATAALNPYGFRQVILPLDFVQSGEYLRQVVEFTPTFQTPLKFQFIALCLIGVPALLLQPRRRPVDWLLFIFFGYLGFRYARNVALFALIAYQPIYRAVSYHLDRLPFLETMAGKRIAWISAVAVMAAGVSTVAARETWGVGPMNWRFPVEAAKKIAAWKPPGQLFNSYPSGGYLAWELYDNYRISIDGRHYGMDKSFVQNNQVFEAKPGWQKVLSDYGVTMIFTSATSPFTGVLVDLIPILDADEGWLLVSAEPSGLLYMRREIVPPQLASQMPDQNLAWWQVIDEAKVASVASGCANAYLSMGIAYFYLHKLDSAVEYLRKYTQLTPGDTEAVKMLATLERGGRFDATAAPHSSKFRMY